MAKCKTLASPPLIWLCALLCAISNGAQAQSIVVDDSYTAQQLVDALVDNSCAQISNVTVRGADGAGGPSYGYFTAPAGFPFESGILLSSGFAKSAMGPNSGDLSEDVQGWRGDNDLQTAVGIQNTLNATVLEFDFVPITGHISFDFIFFSEEYTSGIGCDFSDAFAFLLKDAASTEPYRNLALIPGTNTPVMVTTVRGIGTGCPAANIRYFDTFNNPAHTTTNFNGQTKVLTAEADVVAGTVYHIKLVIADQTDSQYDSAIFLGADSFTTSTDLGPDRLIARGNPLCENEELTVNAETQGALGYQWYRNDVLLPGEINAEYKIEEDGEYLVKVELGTGCFSESKIKVEYSPLPPVIAHTLLQCDDDGDGQTVYNLNLADAVLLTDPSFEISYYTDSTAAGAGTGEITNPEAFYNTTANQVIYARVENEFGCYSISTVTLRTTATVTISPARLETCDDDGAKDGLKPFDLAIAGQQILQNQPAGLQLDYYTSLENALLAINPIVNTGQFRNTVPLNQVVYARLQNATECFAVAEIELVVHVFEDIPAEEAILCADETTTLDAGNGYTSYSWNTTPPQQGQFITVEEPGTYTATLTDGNTCTGTKTFIVIPSGRATGADVAINDFAGNNNSVSITPEGRGTYEYSLDGVNYQADPVFTGLDSGEYMFFIRDINGCGPIYRDTIYIMDYPRFFTPNGDGDNDVWHVPYLQFQSQSDVTVFDRYGKLITRFGGTGSWDGTFNGIHLPSTDYWFILTLPNGRIIRGHFAMMR